MFVDIAAMSSPPVSTPPQTNNDRTCNSPTPHVLGSDSRCLARPPHRVPTFYKPRINIGTHDASQIKTVRNSPKFPPTFCQPPPIKESYQVVRAIESREVALSIIDNPSVQFIPDERDEEVRLPAKFIQISTAPMDMSPPPNVLGHSSAGEKDTMLPRPGRQLLDLEDGEFLRLGSARLPLEEATAHGYYFTNILEAKPIAGLDGFISCCSANRGEENCIKKVFVLETSKGKRFVLKTLRIRLGCLRFRTRYENEQKLATYLNLRLGQAFPEVFAQANTSSSRFVSYELLTEYRGENLLRRLEVEAKDPKKNVGADLFLWASKSATLLALMHREKVFHRSIAPEHILEENGTVSVVGLWNGVRETGPSSQDKTSATLTPGRGPSQYVLPEPAGDPGYSLEKADVYAWGVSMCELLIKCKKGDAWKVPKRLYDGPEDYAEVRKQMKGMQLEGVPDVDRQVLISAVLSSISMQPDHRHSFEQIAASFRDKVPLGELDEPAAGSQRTLSFQP